jgi:uncharacterized membrane protein
MFPPAVATALAAGASMIVLGPVLPRASALVTGVVYAIGALICHQRPERSFHWADAQLPVCARCTGLYVGAALGAFLWLALARRYRSPQRRAVLMSLIVAGTPTAFTALTAWVGGFDPPNVWRAGLAVPLGLVAGAVVAAVASGELK